MPRPCSRRWPTSPARTALVFDVDGTLAPIAPRPELARVPEKTRDEVRRLAGRYLLVACLSGRPGAEAAALVGVEGLRYSATTGSSCIHEPASSRASSPDSAGRSTRRGRSRTRA